MGSFKDANFNQTLPSWSVFMGTCMSIAMTVRLHPAVQDNHLD